MRDDADALRARETCVAVVRFARTLALERGRALECDASRARGRGFARSARPRARSASASSRIAKGRVDGNDALRRDFERFVRLID